MGSNCTNPDDLISLSDENYDELSCWAVRKDLFIVLTSNFDLNHFCFHCKSLEDDDFPRCTCTCLHTVFGSVHFYRGSLFKNNAFNIFFD